MFILKAEGIAVGGLLWPAEMPEDPFDAALLGPALLKATKLADKDVCAVQK